MRLHYLKGKTATIKEMEVYVFLLIETIRETQTLVYSIKSTTKYQYFTSTKALLEILISMKQGVVVNSSEKWGYLGQIKKKEKSSKKCFVAKNFLFS